MAGIDLAIAADTQSAMSAIKRGLLEPLEDVSDALEQLSDADATRELERSMRDAQRRTEDAKDEIRDLRTELDRAGRAGKDAGRDIDRGMRDAKDGVNDFKDEANSTAREAAASFDGSAESIGDAFQEVAANAFAGFGPAGAVAGLAAAAGLGAVTAELTRQQEEADKLRERLAGIYQAAAEEGRSYIDTAQIIAEANDLMFNPDRADEWKRLQEDANRLGLENYDIIAANTGERSAQEQVQERINALIQQEIDKGSESDSIVGNIGQSVYGLKNRWDEVIEVTQEQQAKVRELESIQGRAEESARTQINRTADVAAARYQGLAERYGVPIKGRVQLEVDDTAVRRYNPPEIVIRTRMGAPKDVTWQ